MWQSGINVGGRSKSKDVILSLGSLSGDVRTRAYTMVYHANKLLLFYCLYSQPFHHDIYIVPYVTAHLLPM